MPTDVIMPQMGESIVEGTITKWLKKPGDRVEKDEPLFEISTDKVDAEIPSPVAGMLTEIKIPEGATVGINTVVAVIGSCRQPSAQSRSPQCPRTDIVMPQMGESIFEGTITKWLSKVGDHVEKDEPLFEISTDKVDAEIPAPIAGILTEIKVPEGATVEINTVVAVIGGVIGAATHAAQHQARRIRSPSPPRTPLQSAAPAVHAARPIRSSPLVRRIAKENNLDLQPNPGTGSNGRITKEDVLRHLSQYGPGSSAAPAAALNRRAAAAAPATSSP